MKILIYHHDDQDGYLSASIAHYSLVLEDNIIKTTVGHYDGDIDFSGLEWADQVYILDYSLPDKVMQEYHSKIIWIDHHKTAIERIEKLEEKFRGIRTIGQSGCLLTWKYFNGTAQVPLVVELINDRDVWNWEFGDDTAAMHEVSHTFLSDIVRWKRLLESDEETKKELKQGYQLLGYIRQTVDKYIDLYAWEGTFEGYPVVFLNGPTRIFGELHKRLREFHPKAQFAVVMMVGEEEIKVGLYRNDNVKDINLGEIASKYGGGGHEGAAGFVVKTDFLSILRSILDGK